MGSPLRLTVATRDGNGERAQRAWAAVVAEFEAAEHAMSRFRDDSELTTLNRLAGTGRAMVVSRRLERALAAADRARRLTGGRFDPRVIDALERLGDRGAPLPAGGRHDGRNAGAVVRRETRGRVRLEQPVDLGGIGKGLTLRWGARVLRHTVPGAPFLLDAGGDLVAAGHGPDGDGWRIGIEDPRGGPAPLVVAVVSDGAIATSSVRVRRYAAGGHHLIDPGTGQPGGEGLLAVTVARSDPAWAEVATKRFFLAGAARVAGEARAAGAAAWWVLDDGRIEMTPAARATTIWVAGEAA